MDKNTSIEFNNVGKLYRLGRIGTGTLQHDLNRWWKTTIMRKPDPYLMVGDVNDRATRGKSDYVWALKDISFKVERGDVVGIIGKNGAGKSTLLKLLSHITSPSTGDINYRGRISSLLEVGTGFHPEMTARENIFMNGSIMGMTRKEIKAKFDDIVDFAGIERYIDTPVKRFSSGMTVRLGFAVAAFLEPEILVVDEVLAVGDAEFQKKAIGKMKDVSSHGGRTVLFVSHNMSAVRSLCHNGIVLKNGMIDYVGTANDCVSYYSDNSIDDLVDYTVSSHQNKLVSDENYLKELEILDARLHNDKGNISSDEEINISVHLKINRKINTDMQFAIIFFNNLDERVAMLESEAVEIPLDNDDVVECKIQIPHLGLPRGRYKVQIEVGNIDHKFGIRNYDIMENALSFEVKYIHEAQHDDFLVWNPIWGKTLRIGDGMKVECVTNKYGYSKSQEKN